jgi:triose/dihydroxyacetone kinase / FAD-AMP lyase (cyclizing)
MSLDTCTVPGLIKEGRVRPGEIELGAGIHGEPGVQAVPYAGVRQVMSRDVPEFAKGLPSGRHLAHLNDRSSTTGVEMAMVAEEL